ncbi:MAG: FRG domain-containing protein [Sulfuricurvum sp.]|jgi:hypothetical protein
MTEWLHAYINKRNQAGAILKPITGNIYDIKFELEDLGELFLFLTEASISQSNIYRGISHNNYGIVSSQRLFRPSICYEDWNVHENINDTLENFRDALNHLRTDPVQFSNLELLEYARHMGVPTPIIDFSRSPFVALFFAFCDPRKDEIYSYNDAEQKKEPYALLNIIDHMQLAQGYLQKCNKDMSLGSEDRKRFDGFDTEFCRDRFEANTLQIIKEPSAFNTRMKNQQGLFLYDTLNYGKKYTWGDNFEDMISKLPNPPTVYPIEMGAETESFEFMSPIMIRLHINIKMTQYILTILDRMNINAFTIYPDDSGAAMHAKLTHFYHSSRQVKA